MRTGSEHRKNPGRSRRCIPERETNRKQTPVRRTRADRHAWRQGMSSPSPGRIGIKNTLRTAPGMTFRRKKHHENMLGENPVKSLRFQAPICEYLLSQKPISPQRHPALEDAGRIDWRLQ